MKGKNIISKIVSLSLAAAMCLSLCSFIGTASAKELETAPNIVVKSGVKIYVVNYVAENGELVEKATRYIPKTEGEETVVPFIIEDANGGGTTYLPIRAIANLFGIDNKNITWDKATNTANIDGLTAGTNQTITNVNPSDSTTTEYKTETKQGYTGVTVTVNKTNEYICKDAAGNIVNSYLIDGTTFFPLRALSVLFLGDLDAATMKQYLDFKADSTGENAVFIYNVASKATAQGDITEFNKENPYQYIASLIKAYVADNFPTAAALSEKINTFISQFGTGDNIRDFKDAIFNGIDTLTNEGLIALFQKVADEYGLSLDDMLARINYDNTKAFLTFKMSLKDYLKTTDAGELVELIREVFKNVTISDLIHALPTPSEVLTGVIGGMTELPGKVMGNLSSLLQGGYIPTLSEMKDAFKQVIGMSSSDSIISAVTAWAKARTIGLDDVMEIMGVKSLSDLVKVIKADASDVVTTSVAGQMQQTLKNILFGSDNTNKTITGAALSTIFSTFTKAMLGTNA